MSRLLARLIAARMPEPEAGRLPPVLVPVPLHRWRLWHRGFNQAALLARELERYGKGEADVAALEAAYGDLAARPGHARVRGPETGMVMVRGRAGGSGGRFNLGEKALGPKPEETSALPEC